MDAGVISLFGVIGTAVGFLFKQNRQIELKHRDCEEKNQALEIRIVLLEAGNDSDFPEWKKDFKKRFVWCNGEFVKHYLAPIGKDFEDIKDKTNEQIDFWDSGLQGTLDRLDAAVTKNNYAVGRNVIFRHGCSPATVIKTMVKTKGSPVIFYHGRAYPE